MKKFISLVLSLIIILSVPTSVFAKSTRPENSMPEIKVTGPSDIRSISMESGTTYLLKCDPDYTPAILPNVYMRVDNEDKIILTLDDVIEIVSKELKVLKNGTTRFIAIKYDPKSKKTYVISQIAEKETNCHYLTATDILTKKTVISSKYSMQAEIDSGGEIVVTDAFTQTQYYYSTQTNRYKEAIGDITAGDKAMWIQDGYLCVGNLYWLAMDLATGALFVSESYSFERAVKYFDFKTGFIWWLDNAKSGTNMYSKITDVDGKVKFHHSDFNEMYRVNDKIYAISQYNELCEIIPTTDKIYNPSKIIIGHTAKVKIIKNLSEDDEFDRDLKYNYQLTADKDGNLIIFTEWDGVFHTIGFEK